jgi:hypothetical protein
MIQNDVIEGHIDGNTFVRTEEKRRKREKVPNTSIDKARSILIELLRGERTFNIQKMERESGVDRRILRRTLLILLGDEKVKGIFSGEEFILDDRENIERFVENLVDELRSTG